MRRCGLGSVLVAGVALMAAACGLDTSGSGLFADDGGPSGDGGASGSGGSSGSDGGGSGSGGSSGAASGSSSGGSSGSSSGAIDGGGDANTGPCMTGWTLVLGVTGGGGCPSGYPEAYMGQANPQAQPGACACSCNITQQPSCTTGTVTWNFGTMAPLCFGGSSPVTSNGTCQPYNASLQNAQYVQPLPASGGACTGQAVGDPSKVQDTQVRTCSVPTSDEASVCSGVAPGGSSACIVAAGNMACPQGSPFQTRYLMGDTQTLVCSTCGTCGVSATCSNASLDIYSDMQCTNMMASIPANSTCVGVQGGPMQAFWYKAQVNAPMCKAAGTAPSFQATNEQTLCCR